MKKVFSAILCMVLVLTLCFGMVACGKKAPETTEATVAAMVEGQTYGEGATAFTFTVTDLDKNTTTVTIKTDEETVGAALVPGKRKKPNR